MPEIQYIALGSTTDIGASCHYLNLDGTGILLDSGQDPNREGKEGLPRFELLSGNDRHPVDHVLVTHAHHDHMGSLPVMIKHFPRARIQMTAATRALLDFLLPASAKLQLRKFREGSSVHPPLFSLEQAEYLGFVYEARELDAPFEVTGRKGSTSVHATFHHAGHVLGSSGVVLEQNAATSRPLRIFYSGDTRAKAQGIQPGADYPDGPVDVLIMESTLAADPLAETFSRREEELRFLTSVRETLARGGSVLVPVFALGRAQEILSTIHRFKSRRQLPDDVPVYTTGSMRAVAACYDRTRYTTPRKDPEFKVLDIPQKRFPRNRDRIPELLRKPSIHVLSSGMMFEKTHSNIVARQMLENEKHSILQVGYAKPDSPADVLL